MNCLGSSPTNSSRVPVHRVPVHFASRLVRSDHPSRGGITNNGDLAIALAQRLHPDVIVMDLHMPGMDGLAASAELRRTTPSSAVIMLSIQDDTLTRANGVRGFVGKHQSTDSLVETIREVAAAAPPPP